jgi:8-oxo-dGTP pyrophosphatase MutT (NUDIX family)
VADPATPPDTDAGIQPGRFRQVDERLLYQGWVMQVVVGSFEAPDGARFQRDVIRHRGAVGIVAVDGPDVVMVRQYRPALDAELLEIPAGTRDQEGEDPKATAIRELAEEIGATAEELTHLLTYWVAPGLSDEQMHLYVARGLRFGARHSDGPEESAMTVERVPLGEAGRLIAQGRIVDAKSIIGLMLVSADAARVAGGSGGGTLAG